MLSGRGLCDGLIIRSEESYRLWRVVVCDHETSQARRLKPARRPGEKKMYCLGCGVEFGQIKEDEITTGERFVCTLRTGSDQCPSSC